MNEYEFHSSLLVRTPLFSSALIDSSPACLLRNDEFKAGLFLASRSFFNELSKKDFNYDLLSEKQQHTVKKYLNRATFRSTPFGLFSSVCSVPWTEDGKDPMELSQPTSYLTLDFSIAHLLWEDAHAHRFPPETEFRTNPSLYATRIDLRYFKKSLTANRVQFSVVSVEKNDTLLSLLHFCNTPRLYNEIRTFLSNPDIDTEQIKAFVTDLLEEQVLVPETAPNVTGTDVLEVMATHLPVAKTYQNRLSKLGHQPGITGQLDSLSQQLDHDLTRSDNANYFYAVSERKMANGGLPSSYQQALRDGLHCLQLLSSPAVNSDLESFKQRFTKKYEGQSVPLLLVMDAQFGIGYGGLDKPRVTYGFSSAGYRNAQPTDHGRIENDSATLLIRQWHQQDQSKFQVELTDQDLESLQQDNSLLPPPSFSVLFRTLDERIVIESAGGASALPLLGRFSVFNDIYEHGKWIAEREQELNNQVLFAEISHLCDLHTANINRRAHFYSFEIPVLTPSTLPEERQIQLSDLLVTVKDNRVVLLSRRLKKVVVPRLSSAFNYTKNDLPVFRFLCDLQNEGLKTHLGFSLPALVPGLPFYPRIVYKSCILQLAEWHLPVAELRPRGNPGTVLSIFREKTKSLGLTRFFSYTVGDNFLVFDCERDEDLLLFLSEIQGKENVVLKEFPFTSQQGVRDEHGRPLIPQYMATVISKEPVYSGASVAVKTQTGPLKQSNTKNWIYFKLYCHPLSSDAVLTSYIFPLVEKLKTKGLISRWFWIRYNDPDYHLRLRLRVRPGSGATVLKLLTVILRKAIESKLVSHFQSATYNRELERYSPDLIGLVEDFFQASSELIAPWLREQIETNYEDQAMMIRAVQSSVAILGAFGLTLEEKVAFSKNAFDGFFQEFAAPKTLKGEMEKLYRELSTGNRFNEESGDEYLHLKNSIQQIVKKPGLNKRKLVSLEKLAGDLIHMHVNRLFIYEQRYFEMVHYFLLYRILSKQLHQKNPAAKASRFDP